MHVNSIRCVRALVFLLLVAVALTGCRDTDISGFEPRTPRVLVLNSVGQTLTAFDVGEEGLEALGTSVTLPENFDGSAMDFVDPLVVSTISSLNGSQVVFANAETGETATTVFPGDDAAAVDPSKPTITLSGANVLAWVAGRGSDDVYRVIPGQSPAELWVEDVGVTVERVLPFQDFLLAVDANLDDEGGTFESLGPSAVVFMGATTRTLIERVELTTQDRETVNAGDALLAGQEMIVLGQGTFELSGGAFVPQENGTLATVSLDTREVDDIASLQGNAISMEPGADNRVYIVRQLADESTDVLVWEPFEGVFVRGPADPIRPTDAGGEPISCWVASGLADGRIVCVTFEAAESGRVFLLDEEGAYLDDASSGFGSTDLVIRRQ